MESEQIRLPQKFVERMREMLGDEWENFHNCYLNDKYQSLRINTLKVQKSQISDVLQTIGMTDEQSVPWENTGIYYNEEIRPGKQAYHEVGLYYIQEPSAMSAAAVLHPQPGERVLDLCAAPGGKSTQLAGYMQQQGLLVSNEIHPARCKILSQNIERLGIRNAIVTNEDSQTLAKRFPEYFHKILVDAPCSGEGMFRKMPEACEEWSPSQVLVCAERQLEILNNAAEMLMPGGKLCYSTCTFAPDENEGVIGEFLSQHPEFSVVQVKNDYFSSGHPEWGTGADSLTHTFRLWPHKLHGEGHYVALLEKAGNMEDEIPERKSAGKYWKDKKMLSVVEEFVSQSCGKDFGNRLLEGPFLLFGEQLYKVPQNCPDLDGMKVLRPGLHIGTFKKNRFEPSHALALTMSKEDAKQIVELSEDNVCKYFNGESLECENQKGWSLVCIDGYSAGWGKAAAGQLKNHYPKGLRREVLYKEG